MRILIPVDPEIPVPPPLYGGVERLVDGLIEAYTALGHEVILLAHADSTQKDAFRRFGWPSTHPRGFRNVWKNAWALYRVSRQLKPDVIHSFGRLMYLYPSVLLLGNRVLMTYGRFISPRSTALASLVMGKRLRFSSAAGHMLNHLKYFRRKFTAIYNFTPVDYYTPDEQAEPEYLMFLGRIEDIKGTKECIDVALRCGEKLLIAGNIQPGHEDWFKENIETHLGHPLIEYAGPVNDEQKRHFLRRAKALLFPIKWEEPFGIVMAEAMACGTPVIGFRRGSVPEIIIDGKNGFIVDDVAQMCRAVEKIAEIDRKEVRSDCVKRFSREKIAEDYLQVLRAHRKEKQ